VDDLFRFISVRPAQSADTAKTVSISGNTPFQKEARSNFGPQTPPEERWQIVRRVAEQFIHHLQLVTDITSLAMYSQYRELRSRLEAPDPHRNLASVGADIQNVFGNNASGVVADAMFQEDRARVWDSILLIFLLPQLQRGPFAELVEVAQVIDIIRRVAVSDTTLDSATAIEDALAASLVLPPDLFPSVPGRLKPVGIADLLVVKQHIQRYELGEIVQIENILRGESRTKATKHTLSNERTVVMETTTTTEKTNDLQTSERFALKREAENTVKEDTSVKAGVSATYKYGDTLQINANVNVDYSNAKTDSQKVSSDYAKDVVARATSKVTEQIRQQETTRVLETFEEGEDHSFDNTKQGATNISGIYQWVNKVYKAQVFSYGKRLLFDIMVPEPAALLIEATTNQSVTQLPPGPPEDFKVSPADLSSHSGDQYYYGQYLAKYDVEGLTPPPLDHITVAKTFTLSGDDTAADKGAEVPIPENYRAIHVHVGGEYNATDSNNNGLNLWVGDQAFQWVKQQMTTSADADLDIKAAKAIPMAIETWSVSDYGVLVEIDCEPLDGTWEQWRLDTHTKILAAWQKKLRDYQDALSALKFTQPSQGPLGSNNPDDNRRIERTELKRAAIALLSGNDLLGFNAIDQDPLPTSPPPNAPPQRFPRPNPQASQTVGNYARFFEQAFEWEQISYVFYPYYWARREVWYDKVLRTNDDPLFAEFLRAGQARVVVPARPSLEPALWYFLMMGQIWEGRDPPMVTDADYLPIVEEIKEDSGAPGDELPYGQSTWEVSVPTTLIKLRDDDQLSNVTWNLTPPWTWTSK